HFFGTLICAALLIVGLAGVGLGFVGAEVLGIAGVALIIAAVCIIVIPAFLLLKWYITSRMQSLTVTSERLTYRYGLIHRGTSEIRHEDVRNMKINQNLFER